MCAFFSFLGNGVVIDCNWKMETIEKMVNELICIQLDSADNLVKKSYYDILNAWHQKHFGCIPVYRVNKWGDGYWCEVRFNVPKNDKGVHTIQRLNCDGEIRSRAREDAARRAYEFIVSNGLWKNLGEAGIVRLPRIWAKRFYGCWLDNLCQIVDNIPDVYKEKEKIPFEVWRDMRLWG